MSSRSTGRVPMAQPPGSDTRASPQAREQRREHPEARPHARDEFIGRGGVDDFARGEMNRAAGVDGLAGALAGDGVIDAMIAEDALEQHHIREQRHVVERQRLAREERCDHQRQGGVLRAGNRDHAIELVPPTILILSITPRCRSFAHSPPSVPALRRAMVPQRAIARLSTGKIGAQSDALAASAALPSSARR